MSPKRWAPAKRASAAAIAPKRSAASPPPRPLETSSVMAPNLRRWPPIAESSFEEKEEKPAKEESEQETSDEEEEETSDSEEEEEISDSEEEETSDSEEEEEITDDEEEEEDTSVAAMAPNRLAAPTPPLPPVASSEKTASGSGAEEEEKEIVPSLPPAAPKSRLLDLGKNVWPSSSKAAANRNSGAGREPDEMCELYPCLAEEVKAIQKEHPGLFKREFGMIEDSKARALEEEIRKQRLSQMRLRTKVTKTLLDLAE